jgi:hypothetical protein
VLVYMRTAQGNDALAWMDEAGKPVTQSQLTILKAAACAADTPALPRTEASPRAHPAGPGPHRRRRKVLWRCAGPPLRRALQGIRAPQSASARGWATSAICSSTDEYVRRIDRVMEEIYRYPLYQSATDSLNRQLKAGIGDHQFLDLVFSLREDGRLCVIEDQDQQKEPKLICSMGLA